MLVNYCFHAVGPILKLMTSINIHVSHQLTAYPDQFLLSLPREIAVSIMNLFNYLSDRTQAVLIREGLMLVVEFVSIGLPLNPQMLGSFQMGLCLFASAYPIQRRNVFREIC